MTAELIAYRFEKNSLWPLMSNSCEEMFESVESVLDADFGKQVRLHLALLPPCWHSIVYLQSEDCILHLIDEDERTDGRTDGQTEGPIDGRNKGQTNWRTNWRTRELTNAPRMNAHCNGIQFVQGDRNIRKSIRRIPVYTWLNDWMSALRHISTSGYIAP